MRERRWKREYFKSIGFEKWLEIEGSYREIELMMDL